MTEDAAALVADGITKRYGEVTALAPLALTVPAGQGLALVGHNGSGKSTFLRLAAGVLEASAGEVWVHGEPAGSLPARAAVSYLPDEPVLYDDLSVREHGEFVNRLHGGAGWDDRADDLAERLGLTDRVDDLPARFSRGLRQKTSILLGLVRPASLLLVDEPFVGLDARGRAAMLDLVDQARTGGATVVLATHDPEFVERVERCVALRDGEVIHDGTASVADVLRLVS
ncbi:ABC transporter ATP-binding protein [soil metagenome]